MLKNDEAGNESCPGTPVKRSISRDGATTQYQTPSQTPPPTLERSEDKQREPSPQREAEEKLKQGAGESEVKDSSEAALPSAAKIEDKQECEDPVGFQTPKHQTVGNGLVHLAVAECYAHHCYLLSLA